MTEKLLALISEAIRETMDLREVQAGKWRESGSICARSWGSTRGCSCTSGESSGYFGNWRVTPNSSYR